MNIIEKIKQLYKLSPQLYQNSQQERHLLSEEESKLDITPLGEMEVHCEYVAGIAYSISKRIYPFKYLEKLKTITIESGIPNYHMIKKYPTIVEYIYNWEKIKSLCIKVLEEEQNN